MRSNFEYEILPSKVHNLQVSTLDTNRDYVSRNSEIGEMKTTRLFSTLFIASALFVGTACNGGTQTIAVANNTESPVTVTMELESGYSARGFQTGECGSGLGGDFDSPFEMSGGTSTCIEGGNPPAAPSMPDRFETLRVEQGDTTCLERSGDAVPDAFDEDDRPTLSISSSDCS